VPRFEWQEVVHRAGKQKLTRQDGVATARIELRIDGLIHFHRAEQDGRIDGDARLLRQLAPQASEQIFSRKDVPAGQGQAPPGNVDQNDLIA
jgi:hypothetical protein